MNLVFFSGKCGKDPEVKEVGSKGTLIATFSLATNKKVGDNWVTEWHNIKAWRKAAEKCQAILRKGDTVGIMGGESITESWEKDGKKMYRNFIVVNFSDQIIIEMKQDAPAPQGGQSYQAPQSQSEDPGPTEEDMPF